MKKILLFIMICFCAVFAMAQKPMKTHFVYEVRNSQGELIKNADVICTLKVANSTDTVYKETHSVKTDDLGQFSVMLGRGSNIGTSNYSSITWSRTSSYMLYATVNAGNQILGSDVPLTIGGNEDSTTVPNRFATLLPLSRVATTGSYTDLTNRPTSISCFTNDNHFLTSDSTVITTMQDDIDALQTASSNYITTTTLCPTIESNCTNVALQNGSNAFTGNNSFSDNVTFSDTVVVPSGFTFGETTTETCNDIAVNACDLLAVFDSLQRTIKGLNDKIDGLRDTLNQLRAARTPTITGVNFTDKTPVSATATAVCNDGGAAITDYTFSISQNSDMTSPIGTYPNGDNPVYHFTGLQPAHTYYVNVIATNLKGSTTSYPYSFTTPAYKPTAGEQTVTPAEPAGFTVEVPNVTTGGAENAEARVCYGVMTGEDCSTVSYTCTEWETITAGTYQKSVTGLDQPGATYCVKTEIATNNGDSVLTLGPTTVTVPTVSPTLGTPTVTSQTDNSLTVSVPLTDDGGAPITAATLCAYTDADFTTPAGGICASSVDYSSSPITGTITGLAPGTDYYVKATATNDDKTGESGMDTPASTSAAAPTLGTISVSEIAGTSFKVSTPVNNNGATITNATVCAYTNAECTTPEGGICASSVDFSSSPITATITGLSAVTSYYVKVTATNSVGTAADTSDTPTTTGIAAPTLGVPTFTPTSDGITATGGVDLGGAASAEVKVCVFTDNTYTTAVSCATPTTVNAPADEYSTTVTGLDPNTPYYVAVIASNAAGCDTAGKQQITTDYAKPTLSATATPTPDATSISVAGSLTSLGGASSANVKVCAYTSSNYSGTPICGTPQTLTAPGDFNVSVDGLAKGTTYYLAVVSDNGHKTDTVKTNATTLVTAPTLAAPTATAKTSNSLDLSVTVTDDGGAPITAATLCAYTDADFTTPAGGICASSVDYSSSPITGTITGLAPATNYYVKATATNDNKTGESGMDTPASTSAAAPTLGTISVSEIAGTSFKVSTPVNNNGVSITNATVCAYTNAECTTPEGGICASSVDFSSSPITATITGLSTGTSYYVKVTATNSVGSDVAKTNTAYTTVVVKPTLGTPTFTPTSDGITATGGVDLGGAASAEVKVCVFTDNTYTTAVSCGTPTTMNAPADEYSTTVTGLDPNTPYYVAVIASNTAGSDTAGKQQITTDYAKPTLSETVTPTPTATSISVAGSLTSLGGASSSANVKVCAYTSSNYSGTPICGSNQTLTATGDYNVSVSGLTKNTTYYLAVVADNGHKTDTVKTSAKTLNPTLSISSNPSSATVKLCGQSSVTVTYTANLEGGTAETYSWSKSGGSATASTTSTYTVKYTNTGTYTVTCTAAGATATKQVTIASGGTAATLTICEDCNAGSITVISGNCPSLTWVNNADPTKTATTSGEANTVLNESATTPEGVYTVTGTNSDGCSIAKTATLGKATAHPCTVTSLREGTALDGGKWANKEYGTGTQLDSVSDHEGNVYRVVQIGRQCWLKENMRATTEPDGTSILQNPASGSSWSNPRAYYYDNDPANAVKYGCLYNFPGAMNINGLGEYFTYPHRGICPEGWHMPTDAEWNGLATGAGCAYGYDRGTGLGRLTGGCEWMSHWVSSSSTTAPANVSFSEHNSSGFYALPAGVCNGSSFSSVGKFADFWSTATDGSYDAYDRSLGYAYEYVRRVSYDRYYGLSVRCLRD